jgi:hypothetical protein
MIALAAVPSSAVRPVPWARLAWVAWRRHRTTLAATAALLAVIAVYLLINGEHMHTAYAGYQSCVAARSANCQFIWQSFRDGFGQTDLVGTVLLLLPGIVGAFAGAPLVARELETGTFRYAWTQGAGRMRWAIALLAPGAVGVAVIMAAFGILVSWYNRPLVDAGIMPYLRPTVFPVIGPAVAGWALAGFALGVLAGLLCRRVLPALVCACGAWFGLALVAATYLRLNYLSPLTTTSLELSNTDMGIDQWWTKGGERVSNAQINSTLQAIGVQLGSGEKPVTVHPGSDSVDPVQYLIQHGYQQVTSYQPGNRFWTFQWIEFGWLTALSLLLVAASLWLLRRRAA